MCLNTAISCETFLWIVLGSLHYFFHETLRKEFSKRKRQFIINYSINKHQKICQIFKKDKQIIK